MEDQVNNWKLEDPAEFGTDGFYHLVCIPKKFN